MSESVKVARQQRKQVLKLNKKVNEVALTIERLSSKLEKLNEDTYGLKEALEKDKQALSKVRKIKNATLMMETREISHRAVDTALTKEQLDDIIKQTKLQKEAKENELIELTEFLDALEKAL